MRMDDIHSQTASDVSTICSTKEIAFLAWSLIFAWESSAYTFAWWADASKTAAIWLVLHLKDINQRAYIRKLWQPKWDRGPGLASWTKPTTAMVKPLKTTTPTIIKRLLKEWRGRSTLSIVLLTSKIAGKATWLRSRAHQISAIIHYNTDSVE